MATIAPMVIYAPKINGREPGRLSLADLLSGPGKDVYFTCASSVIGEPAKVMLFLTRKGEMLDPGKPLAQLQVTGEIDFITFVVKGDVIAGSPVGNGFTGDGVFDAMVRVDFGGSSLDSPPTEVTVKCSLPGGIAKDDGSTAWINENLAAPRVMPNPVPDGHNAPVVLELDPYDVCEAGDVVLFEWGGEKVSFTVTDPKRGVTAEVPWDAVVRVGGGSVPLTWSVSDVVGNWSRHAPSIRVDVEVDDGTLRAPVLYYDLATVVIDPLDLTKLGERAFLMHLAGSAGVSPGDEVRAYWKATLTDGTSRDHQLEPVTWVDPFEPLNLEVPYAYAREAAGGTVAVWYTLNGNAKLSRTQRYRVTDLPEAKLSPPLVPGRNGNELDPFTQGNFIKVTAPYNELYMLSGATVTMTIIGRAPDVDTARTSDAIRATDRYWSDDYPLTSSDLGKPVVFDCPATELQAVENGTADFYYEITPPPALAASWPGGIHAATKVSETLTLQIRRAGAPSKYGAPTDPNVRDGMLDPNLPSTTVTIPLPTNGGPAAGTDVTLNWVGTPPYSSSGKVPSTAPLTFRVGADYIGGSRGTTVNATYHDAAGRLSETLSFRVGPADLAPPTVDEATNDTLIPFAAPNGATVRVPETLGPGAEIIVHFDTWSSDPIRWYPGLKVTVPPAEIASRLGERIDVSYTVDGAPSPALSLRIQAIADGDLRLPKPVIPLAIGGVIDLEANTGEVLITVEPWPLIAEGQRVWLEVQASDVAEPLVLWERSAVTASEVTRGLSKAITRGWLDARPDGATITPRLWVTFDTATDKTKAVMFPGTSYIVKNASDDVTEDFETVGYVRFDPEVPKPIGKLIVTGKNGGYGMTENAEVLHKPPFIEDRFIYLWKGDLLIELPGVFRSVRFGAYSFGNAYAFTFLDEMSQPIGTAALVRSPEWVTFSSSGKPIKFIMVTATTNADGLCLDNFTLSQQDLLSR
ncbi:hypothetical protein L2Y96_10060 [Luteibacter aegosomaticola]|uniref:hypothetical protein n=1 Tax=Luteibacter aegosomaticola TaxID=2911538 RepID=UPI001FF94BA2|nr:hypothetical protein [Luteibacter aegosomaticola]UPG92085.1 hypothetical protein L2Y96_10060 [Luteibacter aegosomaticola]